MYVHTCYFKKTVEIKFWKIHPVITSENIDDTIFEGKMFTTKNFNL